jgi:hypothetical protein
MEKSGSQKSKSPSQLIDARIEELGDWRGKMLSRLRTLVKEADPEVVEELKWRGVPVWSHDGMICTGETYKHVVKTTFAKGAALKDPSGLFNSSLDIAHVFFNGAAAQALFERHVAPVQALDPALESHRLPSTSPAHAGASFAAKLQAWGTVKDAVGGS